MARRMPHRRSIQAPWLSVAGPATGGSCPFRELCYLVGLAGVAASRLSVRVTQANSREKTCMHAFVALASFSPDLPAPKRPQNDRAAQASATSRARLFR